MAGWLTCPYCGERYWRGGPYTSPENARRDEEWWKTEHESGKCRDDH